MRGPCSRPLLLALVVAACTGGSHDSASGDAATAGTSAASTGDASASGSSTGSSSASGSETGTATSSGGSSRGATAGSDGTTGSTAGSGGSTDGTAGTAGTSASGTSGSSGGAGGSTGDTGGASGTAGSSGGSGGSSGTTGGQVPDPFGCEGQTWKVRLTLPNNQTATYDDLPSALATATNGSTLEVCPGTYTVSDTIEIPVSVTIRGSGRGVTVFDGAGAVRLFEMLTSADNGVVIEDMTLQNGFTQDSGGAILAPRPLTVRRVDFLDNHASQYGGAIQAAFYWYYDLVVEDCHFEGNRADLTGGAVFLQGKTTVSDTTFVANTAGIDGCAMVVSAYDKGTTPADRTFDTVVVHQNACDGQGGALRVSSAMRCIDCDFGLGPTDNAPGDVSDYDDLHTNYADGLTFDCTIQVEKPQCPDM